MRRRVDLTDDLVRFSLPAWAGRLGMQFYAEEVLQACSCFMEFQVLFLFSMSTGLRPGTLRVTACSCFQA